MLKDDMIMKTGIIHILDSSMGMPVLSDCPIDLGSDLCDFLKAHIEKFTEHDDTKQCQFSETSSHLPLIQECTPQNFVEVSKELASHLFSIMNSNIDIPPADLAIVVFSCNGDDYLALLKLNYKTSYTHTTNSTDDGNANDIILQKAILPSQGQRLTEACTINLSTGEILLTERKYEINGEKRLYFSELFLDCHAPLSQKSRLDIVTKAVEQVSKKYYGNDNIERKMEVKDVIQKELSEKDGLNVQKVKEKLFSESPEMQEELESKLDKYHMTNETIKPKSETTIKKFQTQHLTTDTGIEITIPMEEYRNPDHVEFITNPNGTISVFLKNIGHLTSK